MLSLGEPSPSITVVQKRMSSAHKSPPPLLQQQEITTKKKFGKNLNKLTKPPPAAATSSAKSNANSRNGLLLLSTKRPSSGAAAVSTGGILASKSATLATAKPLPSLGLQNKSSPSTHDALLGAVVGASRAESQEPDAWGVAERHKGNDLDWNQDPGEALHIVSDTQTFYDDHHNGDEYHDNELASSNWEEYGGRNSTSIGGAALYDPVGGTENDANANAIIKDRAEKKRAEEELRQNEQRERATQKLRELDQKVADEARDQTKVRSLYDPSNSTKLSYSVSAGGKDTSPSTEPSIPHNGSNGIHFSEPNEIDSYSRQPVIHLSSYDDRDRGERGVNAAPRMLYDPKSGSMVAVPTRDESAAAGRVKSKERGKKPKNTKEPKIDAKQDADCAKGARKAKRPDKKPATEVSSPAKVDPKKGKVINERKLPRTCGVLYTRDSKGNFVCVDGCDGDLGYGSHSVPGGRINNPDAYNNYLKEQKTTHEDAEAYKHDHLDASYEADADDEVMLHTGFNAPPEAREVKFEWVKPSDRIELITGVDESPTLQATAKEWAPSQAALAAAAARFGTNVDGDIISEDEDDGPHFGLGFDPTLHMDSMMQSPSAEPTHSLDAVDLPSLSLEPAFEGTAKTNHIFAFGADSTWGTSDSGGNSDSWGTPSSTPNAVTFLSLSSSKTWSGISAFGGTLGSSSLKADHSRSTGD